MAPVILRAEKVSRKYVDGERELNVLQDVDISIHEGEFVSIIGKSGSGKSTLLHILGALDRPTSGRVTLRDRDLSKATDRVLAIIRSEEVGFVYQFHHLLPEFTALENVLIPGMIAREAQKKNVERAEELLKFVGLEERMDHRPSKLSGGEQQRVALARALLNDPSIVVADEPTGNLDNQTSAEVMEFLLRSTQERKKSLIMVTHDEAIAKKADTCYHLQAGRLQKLGSSK